jgi:aspartyl-tRNA(Asn)/glutamyl-tRNA(Gln) amidotransferase subunit A
MSDPAQWDVATLTTAFASGSCSPVEVLAAVRARIAAFEPTINALVRQDEAIAAAADAAATLAAEQSQQRWRRGEPLGPLDGIPVTVKENLARVGIPMRGGCAGATPVVPVRDAPVVERLLEAGAVIVGATTMPDWGMLSSGVSSLHGITRSPWNPELTTGGSSAGAGAAAVAAYGAIHVGTDIGGSIRLPGTWLGVLGHKPSFGRVPLDAPYLGRVAGPLTRTAADAAAAMSVLTRPDVRDWTALPPHEIDWSLPGAEVRGLRVGLWLDAGAGMPCDPSVRAVAESAGRVFENGGAKVEPVQPWLTAQMLSDIDLFWRVRSLADLEEMAPESRSRVLPFVRRWAEGGARASGIDVLRAYQSVMAMRAATVAATAAYDLIVSPVAPMAAFPATWPMPWGEADEGMAHIGFTVPFSMSGQPACSVNAGFLADGRTVGVQVAGPRFDDVAVLRAVAWFEGARGTQAQPNWPQRPQTRTVAG